MLMHQNFSIDPSTHLNGLSSAEKGEQVMPMVQTPQGLYPGGSNLTPPIQPNKPSVLPREPSNQTQSQPQQKLFSPPPQPHQKQVGQTQLVAQRMIQHNRQLNSDAPIKSQVDQAQGSRQPVENVSQMSVESTNVIPPVSSAGASHWKAPDQIYDSNMPNSTMELPEALPPVNQGISQRQSSGGLPPIEHSVRAQWPQQQQQLQQSTPPPPPSQQQRSPSLQPQLPQQERIGQSSLYGMPSDSRLE